MRERFVTGLGLLHVLARHAPAQIAAHVVVSEIYGGGGNIGAVYRNDYVELYNPTRSAVLLTGWSIQYGSATGTGSWHAVPLGGQILPYGYYLVQLAGGTNGIPLPSPDTTGSTNISATAGKIALVKGTTPVSGANPADTSTVDLVGYGSADGYEGSGPSPAPGAATSIERKARPHSTASDMTSGGSDANAGNGWDSNNNAADFVAQASPGPQNGVAAPERPPDDLLPIRFGSLEAVLRENMTVAVSWSTISEIACYGFQVERSTARTGPFGTISGLIEGYGTSNVTHFYSYTDPGGAPGRWYRVKEIDTNGAEWFSESVEATPVASVPGHTSQVSAFMYNYPNPFNPETTIVYRLAATGYAKVLVVDVLGRAIRTLAEGRQNQGEHMVRWDASGAPAGVYFCRLEEEGSVRTSKLVLVH